MRGWHGAQQEDEERRCDTSWRDELTKGWCNEMTARGSATISWHGKTMRGQRNERTRRGNVTTSWHDELTRGRHNEKTTRGYATTSWHDKVMKGWHDKRRHNLVVFQVQTESTGKVAAMVVARTEQKPHEWGTV